MDNNTQPPAQNSQPAAPPASSPTPIAQTTPLSAPQAPHRSRFGLLFGILAVLGIVFLGGTYYVITHQSSTSATPIVNKTVETQTELHKLDEDLQSLEEQNIESDFTEVDQELENL